jgi:hypothetical protein
MKNIVFIEFFNLKIFMIFFGVVFFDTNMTFSQDSTITRIENENSFKLISAQSNGTFQDTDGSINRDFEMAAVGIKAFFRLVKLNENTGEFNSNFVQGRFFKDRAEIICSKLKLKNYNSSGWIDYSADKIDTINNKIILNGNARIFTLNQEQYIEANEIIIDIKKHEFDLKKKN